MLSAAEQEPIARAAPTAPYPLLVLFLVFTLAVAGVFSSYYRAQTAAIEREVRNQLLAVADMKVGQITEWREARLGSAQSIMADAMSLTVIRRFLAQGGSSERAQILTWLQSLCNHAPYADAILTDAQGRAVLSVGPLMGDEQHVRRLVAEVFQRNALVWRDLHRDDPSRPVHLGVNIPLRLGSGAPFGALLLGIDPADYLYPLIRSWPTPSRTAETLLVRRDGQDVLYLNELRGRPGAALNLRVPLARSDIPSVHAALGAEGNFEGPDYRGVPVFAAVRSVPGTPWFLVAKIDEEEVRGPIARRVIPDAISAVALILAVAAGVAFLWRRQQVRFYRDRYRAEVERRALIGHYDYLSRFANDVILLMDEAGRIIEANDRALDVYGYSRDELLALNIRDLRHPSGIEDFENQWNEGKVRKSLLFETVHARRDGSALPVEVSSRRIEVEGKVFRQSIIRDITERKRAEAEHALLEAQLRQAQKMESVGRLAGGVAHDFNNHLTVINGYCDMLLAGFPAGHPAREPLDEIRAAGERAASLTQQLLAFSRKQIAEPQPVSLNEVVADAGGMLRRLIAEDIEIVTALAAEPAVVIADRGQMNQVLMNLAVNARDAMPQGGKLVIQTELAEIGDEYGSLHPDARPGRFVVLSVTDTGVGMDREVLQRIFEPFFTTKKTGAGTGLGLATAYGIVRQSGGWITASSEPGRGACFRVYLAAAAGPVEPSPAQAADAGDGCGSETVLLVEDHPEVLRLIREILRRKGYRLLEAANGAEALAVAAGYAGSIDALVTDVVMPGMNGRELAARLLQLRPLIKVLFTSGYAAGALGTQGVLEPGMAYLPKPFTAAQLALKLRQVIEAP